MIVLDTNVLSEMMRPAPQARVDRWLAAQPEASLFITAITEAELRYGVALLPSGRRRTALERALDALLDDDFASRILPFDSASASLFAIIAAGRRRAGRPIAQADAQIAAIVQSRGAVLATRNTSDFYDCGIDIVDPWMAAAS